MHQYWLSFLWFWFQRRTKTTKKQKLFQISQNILSFDVHSIVLRLYKYYVLLVFAIGKIIDTYYIHVFMCVSLSTEPNKLDRYIYIYIYIYIKYVYTLVNKDKRN